MSELNKSAAGLLPADSRQSTCFACGPEHSRGLRLSFETEPDGAVCAAWIPDSDLAGYPGVVHGGIVSTVLDEAMAKAVIALSCQAVTAELRVRFREAVSTGERLLLRGWVVAQKKRVVETEAALLAADGSERAHAWASFVVVKSGSRPVVARL